MLDESLYEKLMCKGSDIRPVTVKLTMKLLEKYLSTDLPPSQFLQEISWEKSYEMNDPIFAGHKKEVAKLFLHIVKMEKFLRIIAEDYCKVRNRRRDDDVLMIVVMLYVIVFKLTRASRSKVKDLLTHLHPMKAYHLLAYVNSVDFTCLLKEAAGEIFDYDYVKENILLPFVEQQDMLKVIYQDLRCDFLAAKLSKKIPLTKPKTPPVLQHRQAPPPVPTSTPVNFPNIKYARDIPKTTYEKPHVAAILEKKAQEHREECLRQLRWSRKAKFRCANVEKSQRYRQTVSAIATERAVASTPVVRQSKLRTHKKVAVAVKGNATTVLREGARLLKDEEKIAKKLEAMASGSCNFLYYDNLEAEWRRKREEELLQEVARKHLKGQLTYEEAVLARRRVQQSNKEKRLQFEREREELNHKLEQWRTEEQLKVKSLMEKCQNSFKGAKLAQTNLYERKVKQVQELNEESKELMHKALVQREEELSRKISLIKEIRALQSLTLNRVREVDLTETPGIGLMCEMSIAELRERLCVLKIDMQEALEERQTTIKQQRARQQRLVKDTQVFIEQHREVARNTKQEKKKVFVPKTQELEQLRQELEEKRELRKKLQLAQTFQ